MSEVKRLLTEKELDAMMVENCGMENEKLYFGAQEIPEQAGYYSLLVVKEKTDRRKKKMITFVGAGPGAEDLITVRGQNLLRKQIL